MKLVRKDFKRWLEENREADVGRIDHARDCPLCRYLKSCGVKMDWMGFRGRREINGCEYANPPWVFRFQMDGRAKYKLLHRLSGAEALSLL